MDNNPFHNKTQLVMFLISNLRYTDNLQFMGNQCLRDMFHLVDGDNHSNIDHHKDITHHQVMYHLKDINNQRLGIDES